MDGLPREDVQGEEWRYFLGDTYRLINGVMVWFDYILRERYFLRLARERWEIDMRDEWGEVSSEEEIRELIEIDPLEWKDWIISICLENPGVIRKVNAILWLMIYFPRHFFEEVKFTALEECAEALEICADRIERMASVARELGIDFRSDGFSCFEAYHKLPFDPDMDVDEAFDRISRFIEELEERGVAISEFERWEGILPGCWYTTFIEEVNEELDMRMVASNPTTKIFHRRSCPKAPHRYIPMPVAKARKLGYRPCKICKPGAYQEFRAGSRV